MSGTNWLLEPMLRVYISDIRKKKKKKREEGRGKKKKKKYK